MTLEECEAVRCAAALSTSSTTSEAIGEAAAECLGGLPGPADLVVAFFSIDHDADEIARRLEEAFPTSVRIGCCGESILAGAREVEGASALAIWTARLPGVRVEPFHLEFDPYIDGGSFLGWTESLVAPWPRESAAFLLAEPFSFPADRFVSLLNDEQPGVPVVGGMASGASSRGRHRLVFNDRVLDTGAAGVRLDGRVRVQTLVSQGCRPIGPPLVVTRADRNMVLELGGRPATTHVQEIYRQASAEDQWKMRQGLHLGRVVDEYKEAFRRGDFLVRNVIGVDERLGAVAVGDWVRAGQTVQFHVRDAQSADEDLQALAEQAAGRCTRPAGALVVTCNGRGTRMFSTPNHDAALVSRMLGGAPLAGFFAAGEIGPVGGRNFLHGFSTSAMIFDAEGG
jgi:small ligand-binding sensory domain FIST